MVYKEKDVMEALSEIYVDVMGSPVAERTLLRIKQTIKELPVEDVEPVVRCRECKNWHTNYLPLNGKHGCDVVMDFTAPENFCSWAVRKDGDENG